MNKAFWRSVPASCLSGWLFHLTRKCRPAFFRDVNWLINLQATCSHETLLVFSLICRATTLQVAGKREHSCRRQSGICSVVVAPELSWTSPASPLVSGPKSFGMVIVTRKPLSYFKPALNQHSPQSTQLPYCWKGCRVHGISVWSVGSSQVRSSALGCPPWRAYCTTYIVFSFIRVADSSGYCLPRCELPVLWPICRAQCSFAEFLVSRRSPVLRRGRGRSSGPFRGACSRACSRARGWARGRAKCGRSSRGRGTTHTFCHAIQE